MPRSAHIVIVLAALLVAACVPETESFLSEPGKLDKRLIGTWYFHERSDSTTLLNIRRGEDKDKRLRIVWLEFRPDRTLGNKEGPVQWLRYSGFTTRLGGQRLINMQLIKARWPDRQPKRFIMRYWHSKNRQLRFAFMSTKKVREAIKTGKLTGRDEKSAPVITADRKSLIAFIRKHGKAAFEKPSRPMRRMIVNRR